MPTRKTASKSFSPKLLIARAKTIRLKAPKSYTPILITLLIIAAFLVGMLFTKVQYLEQNGSAGSYGAGNQQAAAPQAGQPTPGAKVNVATGHFPIMGQKNAKVTVIEFADLRCPFCEQFFTQTEPQLIKDYVDTGKVQFYFRSYAFLGPASTVAANAAECANDQGKFWTFHDYMYKNQPSETDTSMYTVDNLTNIAGQLGMDTTKFHDCLNNNADNANVNKDFSDGQAAGVSGTPTFFVDGTPLVGAQPYSAFQTLINQELAK